MSPKRLMVYYFTYLGCDFLFNSLSLTAGNAMCEQAHHVNLRENVQLDQGDWSHYEPMGFVGAGAPAAEMNQPSWPLSFPVLC